MIDARQFLDLPQLEFGGATGSTLDSLAADSFVCCQEVPFVCDIRNGTSKRILNLTSLLGTTPFNIGCDPGLTLLKARDHLGVLAPVVKRRVVVDGTCVVIIHEVRGAKFVFQPAAIGSLTRPRQASNQNYFPRHYYPPQH